MRTQLAYRGRVLFEIVQPVITLYAFVYVWSAVTQAGAATGIALNSLITYTVVATFLSLALPGDIISRLFERDIATGDIGHKVVRPLSFTASYVATALGTIATSVLFKAAPILLVVPLLAKNIVLPESTGAWLMFGFMVLVGAAIVILLDLLIGYLCFWLFQGRYVRYFFEAIFAIFSGQFVPLALLPDWMKSVSLWTPTRLVYNDPISVFTGLVSPAEYGVLLMRSMLWLIVLWVCIEWLHRAATHRIFTQGG